MSFREGKKEIYLTLRETEILREIAQGKTTLDISKSCAIKPGTVKTHIRTMFAKTGTSTRAALVASMIHTIADDE